MILIISKKIFERSTEVVIDWLRCMNIPFIRINGNDFIANLDTEIDINGFNIKEKFFPLEAYWFRRWIDMIPNESSKNQNFSNQNFYNLKSHIETEYSIIKRFLFRSLNGIKGLTTWQELSYTKLYLLMIAQRFEITVPDTIVTTSKKKLQNFLVKHLQVITKVIFGGMPEFTFENESYNFGTRLLTNELLEEIPENFSPSLFQLYIEKMYELRVFYLDNTFYSMAIFSQRNEKTKVDFRNYDFKNPNRNIPYSLPKSIENKLREMMTFLNYTTGSIDLIKAKNGEYIFLEINLIGQFGMVSNACNYFLEEKVANQLIKIASNEALWIYK